MNATSVLLALVTLAAGFAAGRAIARSRSGDAHAEREAALAGRDAARTETAQLRTERDALAVEARTAQAAAAGATATLSPDARSAAAKLAPPQQAQVQLKEAV